MRMSCSSYSWSSIRTPSRLHFTLIDLNGERGRVDGSVGVAICDPGFDLSFRPDSDFRVGAAGDGEAALRRELARAAETLGVGPTGVFRGRSTIPPHVGLGAGTQLRLAALVAMGATSRLGTSLADAVEASRRGGTSGIGLHAFLGGGLMVDAGHVFGREKSDFLPSRFAATAGTPPLVARHPVPSLWSACLYLPAGVRGLSGQPERAFMQAQTPLPRAEVDEVCHAVLLGILPAVATGDLASFGAALDVLQRVGWKARHWRRPEIAPLVDAREAMQGAGLVGCGLSSTGPLLFGWFDASARSPEQVVQELGPALSRRGAPAGRIWCSSASNQGVTLLAGETAPAVPAGLTWGR